MRGMSVCKTAMIAYKKLRKKKQQLTCAILLLSALRLKYLYKKVPANDSFAHKGRTVLSALNYKLNALYNVALYHDTPYGETRKNQLQRYYDTIYCGCQARKVYI